MSKKKPTAPIPLTGVVTITTDGRTTLAMKASHRGEDIEVLTGTANCRPGDTYCEYEGARIALARLYGLDPFPKVEKGHWEAATKENCKVGSRVRVVAAMYTGGAYQNGDQGILQDAPKEGRLHHIIFDGSKAPSFPGCWLSELEVWVPDAPEEAKPQEAPLPEAPKPFTPSFQVGDIVRLGDNAIFSARYRGCVARVVYLRNITIDDIVGVEYQLDVRVPNGRNGAQWCLETPDDPAPLELLFRDPQKGGEKA